MPDEKPLTREQLILIEERFIEDMEYALKKAKKPSIKYALVAAINYHKSIKHHLNDNIKNQNREG